MSADWICYAAQAIAGVLYSLFLELVVTRRRYESDYTWATVVGGVAIVGLIVAARLAWAPPPALWPEALVWWGWWLWTYSFAASGLPIVIWQLIIQRMNWNDVIRHFGGKDR